MVKRSLEDLQIYDAPNHFGCATMRIHGKEETGAENFWVGMSTILPGGGASYDYEENPFEKFYFVIEGEITVTDKDGKEYIVSQDESISFAPFEGRKLVNNTKKPVRMIVVINYPKEA